MLPIQGPAPAISESTVISAVGVFLTLTGLIGTFFYVHLGNWYSDLLHLKAKWDQCKTGNEERKRQRRIECHFEVRRLLNHVPLLVSVVTTLFILFLACLSRRMADQVAPAPASFDFLRVAYIAFLVIYVLLTLYFLVRGYVLAFDVRSQMDDRLKA